MADDYMNDILERNDGRSMRTIPRPAAPKPPEMPKQQALPEENQEGYKTHIRCCWCNNLIKDVYIPEFKNGKNGEPRSVVFNYDPCPACSEQWSKMVVFIEVTDKEPYPDCLPIYEDIRPLAEYIDPDEYPDEYAARVVTENTDADNGQFNPVQYERVLFYPTGRYSGVTIDAVRCFFTGDTGDIHNGSVIYIETDYFENAFGTYFTS